MEQNRKTNLSIVTSFLALSIAGATLYIAHLDSVQLRMTLAPDAQISNTYGGLPNLLLNLTLSGEGAPSKMVTVLEFNGDLTRIDQHGEKTGETIKLISVPGSAELPAVLNGGESVTFPDLRLTSDLTSRLNFRISNVKRTSKWCEKLRTLFPSKKKEVEKIERTLLTLSYAKTISEEKAREIDGYIQNLLKDAWGDGLQTVLFFSRAASYELNVSVVYADGTKGASLRRRITIDEVTSTALLVNFNTDRYVELAYP